MRSLSLILLTAAPSAIVGFAPATGRRWSTAPAVASRGRAGLHAESATATPPAKPEKSALKGGLCVVSGFLEDSALSDQFVFDLLHKHEVFNSIVAVCPDPTSARKRLMSRSARYTGLLDVLDFKASGDSGVPDLEGVTAWLAFGADPSKVAEQAEAAKKAGVKHLVVVATGEGEVDFTAASKVLEGTSTAYTFIQTGALDAGKEGGGIVMEQCEGCSAGKGEAHLAVPAGATVVKEDAVRVAAEAFMLPPAKNKAFVLTSGDEMALKYLKSVRGQGYTRQQEVGFLMTGGYQEFAKNETAKAAAEEEKKALENKKLTPEEQAKWDAERDLEDKKMMDELKNEKAAQREAQMLKLAERECERAWLKQRYAKSAEPGAVSPDFGVVSKENYFEANLGLFLADCKERGEYIDGILVLQTEEDRERNRAIARAEAANAALEESRLRREAEKELDKKVEELRFEFEGETYVKFEAKNGQTILLDSDGVDIVGQWNEEEQKIEPYVDDLGILADLADVMEEEKAEKEKVMAEIKAAPLTPKEPEADTAEKEE